MIEFCSVSSKDIQRTPDGQVHLPIATLLYEIKVLDSSSTAGVSHWDRTPFGQPCHEVGIDTLLEALVVGGVDEELRTVWFEHFDTL